MPSLSENIENRVRKLTKPSNHSQGMQPLFEAVSNAFFAIEDRFGGQFSQKGTVSIRVNDLGDPTKIRIEVSDNGIGLDEERYGAFCQVDTDFKLSRGGKGVGRLFWLDAFNSIRVESRYRTAKGLTGRNISFELKNAEQISLLSDALIERPDQGTTVIFEGLRPPDYANHFPKRIDTFLRYFSAHFIADFLVGNSPEVIVDFGGNITRFPKEISDLVVGKPLETGPFEHAEFGMLSIVGFACSPEASTGLDGGHQIHLLADGRTVESRKIDNLLGLRRVKMLDRNDLFFHGCVSGEFLNKRVNEGRTAFNLPETTLKELSRHCVDQIKSKLIADQMYEYEQLRSNNFEAFVNRHPIYGFDTAETQLNRIPYHATEPEEFAAGLVKYQIRRDEQRQTAMEQAIMLLEGSEDISESFADRIVKVASDIHSSEQLALAQHVVRRKLVLEMLEKLIRRIRQRGEGKDDDFHLEKTLHSFICPMHIRGDDPSEFESRAHDLWIVDERLAFTRSFSSDSRLEKLLKENKSGLRPDLIVWNLAFGMGVADPETNPDSVDVSEPLRKVLIVEFKKPGRETYQKPEDQIEQQIIKYLAQLKGGEIETFDRQRVRIANDCIFYCYVIADIVGDLDHQLSSWETTANGQGRVRSLKNQYRGSIEVIQWQDIINDAWQRNQATLHAAGLRRSS